MKALSFIVLVATLSIFQYCSSTKKSVAVPVTYTANLKPLIEANCAPCHFPPKGNKRPYDNYENVKTDINEILRRINLNPGERGFMPFKHPKLSDSVINVFAQFKADGSIEK